MHHKDTRIYQRSLELNRLSAELIAHLPNGLGFLADEIRRASASVLLNFSEGCGRTAPRERRRFFVMAKGSASEVSAAADVAFVHRAVTRGEHEALQAVCNHVCAMLQLYR